MTDLAALAMERLDVFEAARAFTLQLLAEQKISGLRIDHPDGLYDPAEYLQRLEQHYLRFSRHFPAHCWSAARRICWHVSPH